MSGVATWATPPGWHCALVSRRLGLPPWEVAEPPVPPLRVAPGVLKALACPCCVPADDCECCADCDCHDGGCDDCDEAA